jgi:hypothetical protein
MRSERTIASEWHNGQWSSLYAFASSGTVTNGLCPEIRRTYNAIPRNRRYRRDARELRTLYRRIQDGIKAYKGK